MKRLTQYRKNGYQFRLLHRAGHGNVAVFVGTKPGSSHKNYEVVRIQHTKAGSRVVKDSEGKDITIEWEDKERAPSDAQWGTHGFTYSTEDQAFEKYTQIINQPPKSKTK